MRWWDKDDRTFQNLVKGLSHINSSANSRPADEYSALSHALMQFSGGYVDANGNAMGDAASVRKYLEMSAAWAFDAKFMQSSSFRSLVNLLPMIASDDEVRKGRMLVNRLQLTDVELEEARKDHRELHEAVEQYDSATSADLHEAARKLAQLLYVVRCNIDHGEKTPYGPDLAKSDRDSSVLEAALPVLRDVVMRTLDNPQFTLAVYGTLRTGESNHLMIDDLGTAEIGTVRGKLSKQDGYPRFRWVLDGDPVPVELYVSASLTKKKWDELDRFEGCGYRRLLVPVTLSDGEHRVATVYAEPQK